MEQKRMKRKVLKVFETEGSEKDIVRKMHDEMPMPTCLAADRSFETELMRLKEK